MCANSWLLARREAKLLGETYKLYLKKFRLPFATRLIHFKRTLKRKLLSAEIVSIFAKIKAFSTERSQSDVRYDCFYTGRFTAEKVDARNAKKDFLECSAFNTK